MVLPFPHPSLTNLTAMLERVIRRVAEQRRPMPTNPELVEAIGNCHTRSGVFRALGRLAQAGRIRIDKRPGGRRVFLLIAGLVTEWGVSRPSHKPYSRHARGDQPPPIRLAAKKGAHAHRMGGS